MRKRGPLAGANRPRSGQLHYRSPTKRAAPTRRPRHAQKSGVGGRDGGTTKTISQFSSITSTFSENFPAAGGWDAGYDLWTNNWTNETMIWNQWAGGQSFWPSQATTSLTLNGVPYTFVCNGSASACSTGGDHSQAELMFFRQTQVTSGSVDLLAAFQWEVAHGYANATDVPTQLEYGVEVCYTSGSETFPMTGLTMSVS